MQHGLRVAGTLDTLGTLRSEPKGSPLTRTTAETVGLGVPERGNRPPLTEAPVTVSLAAIGIPAELSALIQDRTLERVFHDALFPRLLFRSEAVPELWPVNLGERMVFTRAGRIPVGTTPLTPGQDPTPSSYAVEQWEAEARQFGESIDTHMPSSYVSMAPLFLRNTVQLGLNAGETLNRLVRNALFRAYLGGQTNTIVAALAGATVLQVASLNGLSERVVGGRPAPVSAVNPLPITINVVGEPANTVIGAIPLNPADPFGPGTIQLGTATTNAIPVRTAVLASTRSRITRVGGTLSVDGLTSANILTLQTVIDTVARLRADLIPPAPDGFYHVHLTPAGEAQLFADNAFQRLYQSLPDNAVYRDQAIGQLLGCRFYRNTECPNVDNAGLLIDTSGGAGAARESSEVGAEVLNQSGVAIQRAIVVGGGAIYEKYLDEGRFLSEAGVTGKVGEFAITNGGVAVMTERIRFIMRAPLDRAQQVVSQTWTWSGDFPIPSDGLTGTLARYKRAAVIEHA